jgi:hypothetical protein
VSDAEDGGASGLLQNAQTVSVAPIGAPHCGQWRLILRRLSFLCDGLRVHGSERRQWAGRLIQRAGVIRRMRRLRVRQLLECATRDLAVRVDRQRTFQALTPPFRSLGD